MLASIGTGAWQAVGVQTPAPGAVAARLEGRGRRWSCQLSVDAEGRIEGLLFQPAELADPPVDQAGLVERLQRRRRSPGTCGPTSAPDGTCTPVAELAPDERLPIGSAFKLYVLGAVAAEIEAGDLRGTNRSRSATSSTACRAAPRRTSRPAPR